VALAHHHHHNHFTAFFQDHPGEPVPEENYWTLWCKQRLTEADTLTIRLGATPSGLTSAHLHRPPWSRKKGRKMFVMWCGGGCIFSTLWEVNTCDSTWSRELTVTAIIGLWQLCWDACFTFEICWTTSGRGLLNCLLTYLFIIYCFVSACILLIFFICFCGMLVWYSARSAVTRFRWQGAQIVS